MAEAARAATMQDFVATQEIVVDAPPSKVWRALTERGLVKRVMFGADVDTDWQVDSPITWRGEWQGRAYEDKGTILAIKPERRLKVTHYSPLSGKPDRPENYHIVDYELRPEGDRTRVVVSQSSNPTRDAADHSGQNWREMLKNLRDVAESL
jgi:uncharacterized protein YndB with AHSA1/START domain